MRPLMHLVVVALIAATAYYLWNWQFAASEDDEAAGYAERSCVDAARSRFDTTGVKVNSVRPNATGYVVRASMTLARGDVARVTCLTNSNGNVEDIFVDEH